MIILHTYNVKHACQVLDYDDWPVLEKDLTVVAINEPQIPELKNELSSTKKFPGEKRLRMQFLFLWASVLLLFAVSPMIFPAGKILSRK